MNQKHFMRRNVRRYKTQEFIDPCDRILRGKFFSGHPIDKAHHNDDRKPMSDETIVGIFSIFIHKTDVHPMKRQATTEC